MQTLVLGDEYNQPIQNNLPSELKILCFGEEFNQPICDYIPQGLEELYLSKNYDKSLNNLPVSVRVIRI